MEGGEGAGPKNLCYDWAYEWSWNKSNWYIVKGALKNSPPPSTESNLSNPYRLSQTARELSYKLHLVKNCYNYALSLSNCN